MFNLLQETKDEAILLEDGAPTATSCEADVGYVAGQNLKA
jgi:hypothetical protein